MFEPYCGSFPEASTGELETWLGPMRDLDVSVVCGRAGRVDHVKPGTFSRVLFTLFPSTLICVQVYFDTSLCFVSE